MNPINETANPAKNPKPQICDQFRWPSSSSQWWSCYSSARTIAVKKKTRIIFVDNFMSELIQIAFNIFKLIRSISTINMNKKKQPQVIFADIKQDSQPIVVESLCVNCEQNGKTTILMTKIPFFKQIILSSFFCEQCGNRNNQVQFAGTLPDYGVEIMFRIMEKGDINRQIIKSEHATIKFQELDLQIPQAKSQITTIQGLLLRTSEQLAFHQPLRKIQQPQQYEKIQKFLGQLKSYINGQQFPLVLKMKDPSGNSFIKNPFAPKADKNMEVRYVPRTLEELQKMGYNQENAKEQIKAVEQKNIGNKINFTKPFEEKNFLHYEPVTFEVPCHSCQMPGNMKMCQTSVPYFSDLIIMSFVCDYCGAHSTETKSSGEVKQEACKMILDVQSDRDLKRDLFKSQTCSVEIPEVELQLDYGTLGGVFTTVEGLLQKIGDHLNDNNPFCDSDSDFHARMSVLLKDLESMREGNRPFTLILKDPLAHSFLQNPFHPDEDKTCKKIFEKRTEEENEMLGLNDIKVENYQQEYKKQKQKQVMEKKEE